jgi:hypothetical protein
MPAGRSRAGRVIERVKRDSSGSFVSLVGFGKLIQLLGDEAAERHPAVGGHDLRVPDGRLVKLLTVAVAQAFAPVLAQNGGGALVDVRSALSWPARPGVYFSQPLTTLYPELADRN